MSNIEHRTPNIEVNGRRWDAEMKVWKIPYTKLTLRFLEKYFPGLLDWTFKPGEDIPERLEEAPKHIPQAKTTVTPAKYEEAVTALEQCLTLKRYSWRTVKAYKNCFRQFIRHYDDIKPSQLTRKQIDDYVVGLIREKRISKSHQNQILSAIKMFYAEVVQQEEKVQGLFRPKRPEKLPHVLSENEVTRLLQVTTNLKHRCLLMLIYSAGLRLGEAINLKIATGEYKLAKPLPDPNAPVEICMMVCNQQLTSIKTDYSDRVIAGDVLFVSNKKVWIAGTEFNRVE